VYEVDGDAECVMHVHSPEIWRGARALALPRTPKAATYGTPKMAREVQHVVTSEPRRRIVVMRGHQDGVVAWGANPEAVGLTLLAALVQAFRLER
jgi:ribulose-5-phosphate 4-epimerase/fuculose-1-phosphate aldolase